MDTGSPLAIPTIDQLMRVAPTAVLIIVIIGIGFYAGWKVRGEVIQVLREWLEDRRK